MSLLLLESIDSTELSLTGNRFFLEDPGSEGVDRREIDDDGTFDGRTPDEEELFDAPPSGRPRARLLLEEERDEDDFPGAAAFRVGKPLPRDGMLYCYYCCYSRRC